ncbi:MAG: succinylglutamate desuccinylase [Pseudomonas sp.]|uniref:succinylglutamate desuccinylase n=1 Tax=Pseudomonas sp. TaxID=306 RepID=UPI002732B751|nr:succinylglutamate desuccinylase [Pseudomonas sp.]MDP3845352.1 succinylglutamate desuccinylase [Pseudomonas sp.]
MLALGKLLELTLAGREPAEKIQLTQAGARLHWLAEGALEITPAAGDDNGFDLLLSAGIHGNETAPIELLDKLLQSIASGQLQPRARVLLLLGNPPAMRRGERFIDQDINRLFNGRHADASGYEALRACELERLAANFFSQPGRTRLHYDMHTAIRGSQIEQFALYPYSPERLHSPQELARLQAAGITAVLLQSKVGITFSSYTYASLDAEAFTLELGKARPFGQNQEVNLQQLEGHLHSLIEGTEAPLQSLTLDALQLFQVAREVIKHSDAFRLYLPADVENFSELPLGYLLAEDIAGTRWVIDEPGARIIFPNPKVKNGLRAGLLVVPVNAA